MRSTSVLVLPALSGVSLLLIKASWSLMSSSSSALPNKEKVIACVKYFNTVTGYEPKALITSVNKYGKFSKLTK